MRLLNKISVITGAGSGIGRSIAETFVREGAKVVCVDLSGKEEEVAACLGPAAIAVHADVANSADVQRMINTAVKRWGRLDVLCNNAGFGGPMKALHEQDENTYDGVHAVNLKGVFLGMKYGITAMLCTGGGSIVNTASAVGLVGWKNHSVYAAAKAGVIQLTKCAALDYAEQGIRVNAICPGIVWTALIKASALHSVPPPGVKPATAVPMNRYGLPGELANAALFLASDESSFITGTALPVDGGYVIG